MRRLYPGKSVSCVSTLDKSRLEERIASRFYGRSLPPAANTVLRRLRNAEFVVGWLERPLTHHQVAGVVIDEPVEQAAARGRRDREAAVVLAPHLGHFSGFSSFMVM